MSSYTSTNTSNFNLDKIDAIEQTLDDSVTTLRNLQNGNMDRLDAALQSISLAAVAAEAAVFSYVSVSAAYTALSTDVTIDTGAATTITLQATITTGKSYLISGNNEITLLGDGVTVNGASSLTITAPVSTVTGGVNHVHAVKTATAWRVF